MDSFASAHSALAGLWLRPHSFRRFPSGSSRVLTTIRRLFFAPRLRRYGQFSSSANSLSAPPQRSTSLAETIRSQAEHVTPLQGLLRFWLIVSGASPRALTSRPFRPEADSDDFYRTGLTGLALARIGFSKVSQSSGDGGQRTAQRHPSQPKRMKKALGRSKSGY